MSQKFTERKNDAHAAADRIQGRMSQRIVSDSPAVKSSTAIRESIEFLSRVLDEDEQVHVPWHLTVVLKAAEKWADRLGQDGD